VGCFFFFVDDGFAFSRTDVPRTFFVVRNFCVLRYFFGSIFASWNFYGAVLGEESGTRGLCSLWFGRPVSVNFSFAHFFLFFFYGLGSTFKSNSEYFVFGRFFPVGILGNGFTGVRLVTGFLSNFSDCLFKSSSDVRTVSEISGVSSS